jgi:hypothetical protein
MANEDARAARGAEFQIAALIGHRIAVDTIIKMVLADLYASIEGGAERFEAVAQRATTDMHGIQPKALGRADSEFIRQQALHSLEGIVAGLPNRIRQRRGEPPQRPS